MFTCSSYISDEGTTVCHLHVCYISVFHHHQCIPSSSYIPPNKIEQIHVLDRFLEDQRDEAIIILGDFNVRNTLWDKHTNQNNKVGIALEELTQRLTSTHQIATTLAKAQFISLSFMGLTTSLLKQGKLAISKPGTRPLKLK